MVDAARQMLDELMGRNRNLHPSEAGLKVNWEDPEFCQFYNVKFCPHDLFINTRADLGPCARIHDEEAKHLYEEARPARKRQYEDEFLRFCNVMLHDVDRKIQKGKQRLQLMQRDQPPPSQQVSKHQDQLNTLNGRINKLLAEAEEAGIRGDVDQAKDLMTLCDEVKEEKEQLLQQFEASRKANSKMLASDPNSADDPMASPGTRFSDFPAIHDSTPTPATNPAASDLAEEAGTAVTGKASPTEVDTEATGGGGGVAAGTDGEDKPDNTDNKSQSNWSHDSLPEKQMKVCEICGAFLIVGDAQQRIEDHLMGKQHLGYSKVRNAVAEINDERQKERDQEREQEREHEERRRREGRGQRFNSYDNRREPREYRERSREYAPNRQTSDRRHHHHKSHHGHSYSRSGSNSNSSNRSRHHNHSHYRQDSRERHGRSRSRSRY
ncbi:luc7-like protein 3 [Drosophila guanche]|uniref:Blast:Luc7-like protein 3 n=1 Tax=Drosophila guanche TaxID=7266 RepID=A0A3B0JDS6_DROGU|nr:luc7-like protein 3 [Drosophila guanche]SPP78803.1 blast:Luc7-like protein 3 [Drosophila guanche]